MAGQINEQASNQRSSGLEEASAGFELPDLCNVQRLMMLILLTELLVGVYQLLLSGVAGFDWTALGMASVYCQWIAVLSAAGLCRLAFARYCKCDILQESHCVLC